MAEAIIMEMLLPAAAEGTSAPRNGDGPLFHQAWWLEAAAGPALERVQVIWDGQVVGSLAYVRRRNFLFRLLNMPPYTHTQGPVLHLPESKPAKTMRNRHRVVKELIEQLPKHDRFHLFLDPDDSSSFSFALAGCSIMQDFTFRLVKDCDLALHWENLDQKTRNLVRSADKKLEVRHGSDLESFIGMCVKERGKENTHILEAMRRVGNAALEHRQATVLTANDERGQAVASAVLVWDDAVLYYWQSSRDPENAVPGANNLLVWEAIRFALRHGRTFDLDGYASEGAARFGAKFGMEPVVRASVAHMSLMGHFSRALTGTRNHFQE